MPPRPAAPDRSSCSRRSASPTGAAAPRPRSGRLPRGRGPLRLPLLHRRRGRRARRGRDHRRRHDRRPRPGRDRSRDAGGGRRADDRRRDREPVRGAPYDPTRRDAADRDARGPRLRQEHRAGAARPPPDPAASRRRSRPPARRARRASCCASGAGSSTPRSSTTPASGAAATRREFWVVPVVPKNAADCMPATGACIMAVTSDHRGDAQCLWGGQLRPGTWKLAPMWEDRALLLGVAHDGATGARVTIDGQRAEVDARDGVVAGVSRSRTATTRASTSSPCRARRSP